MSKVDSDKIRLWRKERFWSQEQLAEQANMSIRTVQRMENEGFASTDSVKLLATVYGVAPSELLIDEEKTAVKTAEHQDAKKLLQLQLSFGVHAISYVMVMAMLLLINLAESSGELWVTWPAVGWGIGLLAHGATVYMLGYADKKKKEIQALETGSL